MKSFHDGFWRRPLHLFFITALLFFSAATESLFARAAAPAAHPALAVGGGINCAGVPTWQNNGTLYQANSYVIDPANNSEYKALVTCWGYNGEPSTTPSIWTFVGVCGGAAPTSTPTWTFTSTLTPTKTPGLPTASPTGTATGTSTGTAAKTATITPTLSPTDTAIQVSTHTPTLTETFSNTPTFTVTPTVTVTSTATVTLTFTFTLTSGSSGCAGAAVWQNNSTLYQAGSLAVDPANNGEYKALVTCWGYNGEPSTSPTLWSYMGPCGSISGNTATLTPTVTRTNTPGAALTATPTCGTNYPSSASVPLTLQGQQESEWCWAACSSMEMSFFGVNITQCSQATAEYGTNCCVANQCDYYADGAVCNPYAGGVVDIGSYGFNALGSCEGTFPNTGTTLTFAQIEDQIYCQKKPYIFAWNWEGGGGHVIVVVGYSIDPVLGQMVEVDDPLPDCQGANRLMTYGDYVGETNGVYYTSDPDGGEHSHQCDIYDVTYSGGN